VQSIFDINQSTPCP